MLEKELENAPNEHRKKTCLVVKIILLREKIAELKKELKWCEEEERLRVYPIRQEIAKLHEQIDDAEMELWKDMRTVDKSLPILDSMRSAWMKKSKSAFPQQYGEALGGLVSRQNRRRESELDKISYAWQCRLGARYEFEDEKYEKYLCELLVYGSLRRWSTDHIPSDVVPRIIVMVNCNGDSGAWPRASSSRARASSSRWKGS